MFNFKGFTQNISVPLLLITAISLTSCSVNPVTGKQNFQLLGTQAEIAIGEKQYQPGQQSQGGVYDLDPDLTAYIREVGHKLAQVSDKPKLPYDFVVLNHDTPNAWALPGGKIAINRGLLYLLKDEAELAAVLAHEIVHAAASHGAQQLSQGLVLQGGVQILSSQTQNASYAQLANIGAALWQARYSREHELESDQYGMNYMALAGYDPYAAVRLQEALLKISGSSRGGLFASHPPSQQRADTNRQHAKKLPSGKRFKQRYQQAIAKITKDKPAYDLSNQAKSALEKKDLKKALNFTNRAIKLQPREVHFYLLKGEIQKEQMQLRSALTSFNRAVEANPSYFLPWLLRGLLNQEIGKKDLAKTDLKRSYELLPTQAAANALQQHGVVIYPER